MLIDTHCHMCDKKYEGKIDEIVSSFDSNKMKGAINISCDKNTIADVFSSSQKYSQIFCTLGIHPENCEDYDDEIENFITLNASNHKVVAIGEIGLDYYFNKNNIELQKRVFIKQIKLAHKLNLPMVLHIRDSYSDVLTILKENKDLLKNGFVAHCYSGSVEYANELLKLGGYFSFGGVITFQNSKNTVNTFSNIPLERILVETDSPYLAPVPFRSQLNYPYYAKYMVSKMAEIKNMTYDDLEKILNNNAKKLFKKLII